MSRKVSPNMLLLLLDNLDQEEKDDVLIHMMTKRTMKQKFTSSGIEEVFGEKELPLQDLLGQRDEADQDPAGNGTSSSKDAGAVVRQQAMESRAPAPTSSPSTSSGTEDVPAPKRKKARSGTEDIIHFLTVKEENRRAERAVELRQREDELNLRRLEVEARREGRALMALITDLVVKKKKFFFFWRK